MSSSDQEQVDYVEDAGHVDVVNRLDELRDLFQRRLLDDRGKREAIETLREELRQAKDGPFREFLEPLIHGLALVIDRLDRYDGADPQFVRSVRDELLDVLARHGVTQVEADVFDPDRHEAVASAATGGAPAGRVVELRRRGFAHGSRVFRPAQVVVTMERSP
ncbi:MAG: nucleotide exchange factor GrpE [Streptosporangiales bacterium]